MTASRCSSVKLAACELIEPFVSAKRIVSAGSCFSVLRGAARVTPRSWQVAQCCSYCASPSTGAGVWPWANVLRVTNARARTRAMGMGAPSCRASCVRTIRERSARRHARGVTGVMGAQGLQPAFRLGDAGRLDPIAGGELGNSLGEMIANGAFRELQPARDLAAACAVAGELEHFALAVRQRVALDERLRGEARVHDLFARMHAADGISQLARWAFLQQVPAHAGFER